MAPPMATKKAAPASTAKKAAAPKKAAPKKASTKKAAPGPATPAPSPAAAASHAKDIEKQMEKAEHKHQDPRGATHAHNPAPNAPGVDPRKDQGAIKNRAAGRVNKVVNWFRRGRGR